MNGSDYEIELADDTSCDCTAEVDVSARSGVWIHRSGGGAAKPVVVTKQSGYVVRIGSDSIVEGLEFKYDGVRTRNSVYWGISKTNVALIDCDYNECTSIVESGSDRFPSGVLLLRLRQQQRVDRYAMYGDHLTSASIVGCDFAKGSTVEHTVRLNGSYLAVEYSTLDYRGGAGAGGNKSAFRCYGRHVGVYRSVLANGSISLGNIDLDTSKHRDYCIDGCRVRFDAKSYQSIIIWETAGRVVLRTSWLEKTGSLDNPLIEIGDNANHGVQAVRGVRLLNLSVRNTGTWNNSTTVSAQFLTQSAQDVLVRGCMWQHYPPNWTWAAPFHFGSGSPDWLFEDCVHTVIDGAEFTANGANFAFGTANAEPWAEGLIQEDHTFSADGEPLGSGDLWKAVVRSTVGVFRPINGQEWAVPGPAGAWYPPAP